MDGSEEHGQALELGAIAREGVGCEAAYRFCDRARNARYLQSAQPGAIERSLVAAHPALRLIDLNAFVCPKGTCHDRIDGALLRPGGLHFEGAGADVTVRWLAPRVRPVALPQTEPSAAFSSE